MTGSEPPAASDALPVPGGGAVPMRRWFAALAAIALIAVPPAGPWSLLALGFAFLVLLVSLWPPRDATGLAEGSTAAWAGGAVLALGLLAAANPWVGILDTQWPWSLPTQDRAWSVRMDALATIFLALVAIVVGLARPRRASVWVALLALGLFLAARGYAESPAFRLIRIERLTFSWTLGACALGGGLLHLASPRRERRGLARGLLLAGTAAVLAVYLASFPGGSGGDGGSLQTYLAHYRRVGRAILLGQETSPEARHEIVKGAWAVLVPFTLQGLALLASLGLALLPSRRHGRGVRYVAALAWLALFLTWVVPPKAGMWFFPADPATAPMRFLAGHLLDLGLRSGLPTWLIVGGSVAALLARPAGEGAAGWARGHGRTYAPRWPYAVGALATIALVVRCFHAGLGSVLPEGLAAVFRPLRWDPAVAIFSFQSLLLLSALVALLLPSGAGRGGVVATVAVLVWAALAPGAVRDYGLEAYVPLGLLAVSVGALWAGAGLDGRGRDLARLTAGAAGGLLLLLLVYPLPTPLPPEGVGHAFVNPAMEFLSGWAGDATTPAHVAASAPWRLGFLVYALVGLLAIAFALRGRATGGRVAVALFLLHLGYALLWPGLVQFHDLTSTLLRCGDALREQGLPMALLLAAGVRDLHAAPGSIPSVYETTPARLA